MMMMMMMIIIIIITIIFIHSNYSDKNAWRSETFTAG